MSEGAAECGARTEGDQQIKSEHRGRQHDGQRADGLDKDLRAAAGKRQPAGQRHGDHSRITVVTSARRSVNNSATVSMSGISVIAAAYCVGGTRPPDASRFLPAGDCR